MRLGEERRKKHEEETSKRLEVREKREQSWGKSSTCIYLHVHAEEEDKRGAVIIMRPGKDSSSSPCRGLECRRGLLQPSDRGPREACGNRPAERRWGVWDEFRFGVGSRVGLNLVWAVAALDVMPWLFVWILCDWRALKISLQIASCLSFYSKGVCVGVDGVLSIHHKWRTFITIESSMSKRVSLTSTASTHVPLVCVWYLKIHVHVHP